MKCNHSIRVHYWTLLAVVLFAQYQQMCFARADSDCNVFADGVYLFVNSHLLSAKVMFVVKDGSIVDVYKMRKMMRMIWLRLCLQSIITAWFPRMEMM